MIPIKLTVEGLYSYQARQEIDFTKLTESHIFGIFGSVGSGKSSILEAITFALYGKTDRLNLSGDNRNYNMMNLKSDTLFIGFEFKVDDNSYRVTVKGRRNTKKFEDVKALDRQAYKYIEGEWIPVELKEIEEAVGLSYENFKRTIIIPQGKFKEFLELGNRDRTQMMKELFNLNKFELYYKVVGLEGKNNQEIQNINGQLQQLGEINPDRLKEAEALFVEVKNNLAELSKVRDEKRKQEKDFADLKELMVKLNDCEQKLKSAKEKEPEINKLEGQVVSYEYCHLHFKALIEQIGAVKKRIEELEKDFQKCSGDVDICKPKLLDLEKQLSVVKKDYDNKDELKVKAEELRTIVDVVAIKKSNNIIKERVEKGKIIFEERENVLKALKLQRSKIEGDIESRKKNLPDVAYLSKAKDWFIKRNHIAEIGRGLSREIDTISLTIKNCLGELNEIISHKLVKDYVSHDLLREDYEPDFFDVISDKYREEREIVENEIRECKVQQKLADYVDSIEDGVPCPLCGSIDHPNLMKPEKTVSKLKKLYKRKNDIDKSIDEVNGFFKRFNELYGKINLYKEELAKKDLLLEENIKELDAHHENYFEFRKYKKLEEIERDFKDFELLQKDIKDYEEKLVVVNKNIEKESLDIERYGKELDKIRYQQVENETKITTLMLQVKVLTINDYMDSSPEDIIDLMNANLKRYSELELIYNKLIEDITNFQKKKAELEAKIEFNKEVSARENLQLKEYSNELDKVLEKSPFNDVMVVKNLLKADFDVDALKKSVARFNEMKQLLVKTNRDLEKQIDGREYKAEEHSEILATIKDVEKNIDKKNRELGSTEALIKKLNKELEQQKELLKKLEKLNLRAEDIKTMKGLFKASGFVNYVSSVHLQNLCNAANDRFYKLTRQKLRLEMTNDNNFQVRDFMNGGKLRNVKTLSGGQTFQASLSLALALADSIQKFTNSSQNFFFLDEGFGSLDKEALGVVFDTLKSLRKENRIIGVISHVEEMQQEIGVYVKVSNNNDKGSMLEFSWN